MPSINHSVIQLNIGVALRLHYGKKFTIASEVDLGLPNAQHPTLPDIAIFRKRELSLSKDIVKVKEPPLRSSPLASASKT